MGSVATADRYARCRAPGGYALVAVLWLCLGIGALGSTLWAVAGHAVASSRNRIALGQAEWLAEGCVARVRAAVAVAMTPGAMLPGSTRSSPWSAVDKILSGSAPVPASLAGCEVIARASGDRLDVNQADEPTLVRLFRLLDMPADHADSLAAAIVGGGAPITAIGALPGARSDEEMLALEAVLGTEPGPISINHAPKAVLGVMPGATAEVVDRILDARRRNTPILSFSELADGLSPSGRQLLLDSLPALAAATTLLPVAWVITVRSTAGSPPVGVVVEVRLQLLESLPVVARRRSWIP